eukprot:TRINITY_DN57241_c0_g1_i2.p1 TRINITY_DN57241_c0_g1~~TRINITY_DN57241_c0_g1_i2.p1  ORF type:complete len:628 (+),score=186.29 TRINITY_DN57241_c0_g1_i2:156-2039(+)
MPVKDLTLKQKQLLPLWQNAFFELPLAESSLGPAQGYEKVVQSLTDLVVSRSLDTTTPLYPMKELFMLSLKVESSRYAEAPFWVARLLADSVMDEERLKVAAKRILAKIPDRKRDSECLLAMALHAAKFDDEGLDGACSAFKAEKLLEKLDSAGQLKAAAKTLDGARKALLKSAASWRLRIAGDIPSLGPLLEPWQRLPFAVATSKGAKPFQMKLPKEILAEDALRPKPKSTGGFIIGSTTEESNHFSIQAPGLGNFKARDFPALSVGIEYLTACEGPFWRKIRGRGLAYGYSLRNSTEEQTIEFGLYRATDPVAAIEVAAAIVKKICGIAPPQPKGAKLNGVAHEKNGKSSKEDKAAEEEHDDDDEEGEDEDSDEDELGLDSSQFEAAQSGVLFSLIESVDTKPCALDMAFFGALAGRSPEHLAKQLKAVQAVTEEQVEKALRKYVLPLFDGAAPRIASLVCPATKLKKTAAQLRSLKPPMKLASFTVDQLVASLGHADGYKRLRASADKALAGAAKGKVKEAKAAKAGKAVVVEKRRDPDDGQMYTLDEIKQFYSKSYTRAQVRDYWEQSCVPEKRVDPSDSNAYTYEDMKRFYLKQFSVAEINTYWLSCKEAAGGAKSRRQRRR